MENKDGKFIDITTKTAPELSTVGMVNSAVWTDFNNDGNLDLVVAGEWMPISIFENSGGVFVNKTKEYGLAETSGWWNSICPATYNEDGSAEYFLGNLGLNNSYNANLTSPLEIISRDFDNNGKSEPLLIMKYPDGYFPVASRSQFISSFPQKAKTFFTYESYAKTNADDLLKGLGTNDCVRIKSEMMANSVMNKYRDGKVSIKPLPNKCQFSCIFGAFSYDFDGNNIQDLLYIGNFYPNNIDDGPYSSSTGGLLSGDSSGNFIVYRGHEIGFNVHSDARAFSSLILGNQKRIFIVVSNNDSLRLFAQVMCREKHIKLNPLDAYAVFEGNDGKQYKQEFYYGSGYLSQSSRYLTIPQNCRAVRIYSYSGKERIIPNSK